MSSREVDKWQRLASQGIQIEAELRKRIMQLEALLADKEYIRMRADYNKGHLSWANMIDEREARAGYKP